jgi:HK97 family phage prohead protease
MDNKMERRFFPVSLRATGEGEKRMIEGYAAVFNSLSVVLYSMFRERIAPGAFAATLGDDIRALWNHNTDFPLGRTKNRTLRLVEDDAGLKVAIEPPATQLARDFVTSIERGDVDQMSFAFNALDETWDELEDGTVVRTLLKVRLFEVSPVTFPAYPATSVGVRGLGADYIPTIPESLLRARQVKQTNDSGLTQARAARERHLQLLAMR